MKTVSAVGLLVSAAMTWALMASSTQGADYNPATTVIVYVHGHSPSGYLETGTFGDDTNSHLDEPNIVNNLADVLSAPTWQTGPTAPNHVAATTYYGTQAPSWYSPEDVAEDAATPLSVPRYALRVAKYIQHVMDRSGATGCTLISGSFGAEVCRYMIEYDVCGLASSQKIVRWMPVVGVVNGAWAASFTSDWFQEEILGDASPEADEMKYEWVRDNISNPRNQMNSAFYGPMIITQFCGSNDELGALTLFSNEPNDGILLCADEQFSGYSTTAALHAATDGTLQMPGRVYLPDAHGPAIATDPGLWAGVAAAATNNKRVTIKMTRFKAKSNFDILGASEYVFDFTVTSPQAATLYGITAPIQNAGYAHGVSPMRVLSKGQTVSPSNDRIFDQIVPPGETSLSVHLHVWELDAWTAYYDMWEPGPASTDVSHWTRSIPITGNSTITVTGTNCEADITTTVRDVY
jgi:hypothetical protein